MRPILARSSLSYSPVGAKKSMAATVCRFAEWCQPMAGPKTMSPTPVLRCERPPAETSRVTTGTMVCSARVPPSSSCGVTQMKRGAMASARTLKPGTGTLRPSLPLRSSAR
ncbi:hypothetical protein D9M71_607650 [compost metagenome]